MKKLIALLLTLMLILSGFTACGSKTEAETPDDNGVVTDDTAQDGDEDTEIDEDADTEEGEEQDTDSAETEGKEDEKPASSGSSNSNTGSSKPSSGTSGNGSSGSSSGNSGSSKPSSGSSGSSNSGSSGSSSSSSKPSSDKKDEIKAPSGTPAEIIDMIYGIKSVDLPLGTMDIDLSDAEGAAYNTGITSLDLVESAASSESMMGSQAYSLVVVKVKDKKNTEKIANEMLNGINQSKWICVTADDLRVAATDDVVVLIMVGSNFKDSVTAKEITDAFKSLCGGLDISLKK
ncbi:MAG: hypothetical protein ACI4LJ_06560 [Anaerovoracaceae bacterium]